MLLPVTDIHLASMCPLHAHADDTQAIHVCSACVHQVAFELYRMFVCSMYSIRTYVSTYVLCIYACNSKKGLVCTSENYVNYVY